MFTFTPYYEHSPPPWEVVSHNSMFSLWKFCNSQKGYIYVAVHSQLPSEPILGGTLGLLALH